MSSGIQTLAADVVEVCAPHCWCTLGVNGDNHNRYRWMPGDLIVRFLPEEK